MEKAVLPPPKGTLLDRKKEPKSWGIQTGKGSKILSVGVGRITSTLRKRFYRVGKPLEGPKR